MPPKYQQWSNLWQLMHSTSPLNLWGVASELGSKWTIMGSLFLTVYFTNFTWRFCTSAQADQMSPFLFLVSLSHILCSSAGCCLKSAFYPMHVKKAEKAYCSSVEARLSTVTPIRKCYKLLNSHKLCRFCWKWWKTNHLQRKWNCLLLTWLDINWQTSLPPQWDLVCGQYWLVPVEEVCFILGVLTGCLCLGYAADR